MRRGLDVDLAGEHGIVVHEHFLPRHLDLLAHHHAVGLVVPVGERVLELDLRIALERLPGPQREAFGIHGHCARDGLRELRGGERDQVADPDLVGEHRAGGQHLHAGDHHAIVLLAHDPQRRDGEVLLHVELGVARGLRRDHRVGGVGVVLPHVLVILEQVALVLAEHRRVGRHAGDECGHVVGRTAPEAVRLRGDRTMQQRALFEVLLRLGAQEVAAVAFAVFLEAEGVAVLRGALEVVERSNRLRCMAECGMGRDVGDLFLADVDDAPVAQLFQVFLAGLEHRRPLTFCQTFRNSGFRTAGSRSSRQTGRGRRRAAGTHT